MRLGAVLFGVMLAGAAPAGAQTPPVVAQAGTVTLTAVDRAPNRAGQTLELGLRQPGVPDADTTERADTPIWPDEVALINADVESSDARRRILVGGAVPAAATAIELQFPSGRMRVPTSAGEAYRGADAGRIRFFLTEVVLPARSGDDPTLIRLLDASGRVIGVKAEGDLPAVRGPVELFRHGSSRLRAVVRPRLAPTPLQPDRVEPELCLISSTSLPGLSGSDSSCHGAEPVSTPLEVDGDTGCRGTDPTLGGFVPTGTSELVVLLGSGRRVRLRAHPAPASLGIAATYVVGTLPRFEAVRGVHAVGAGGRVLARDDDVAAAPGDRRCRNPEGDPLGSPIVALAFAQPRLGTPPGTQVAATPGGPYALGPRLVARDLGDELCVGFDRLDVGGRDCAPPALNWRNAPAAYLTGRAPGQPFRGIGAVVGAPVAFVDLLLRGGGRLRLPTVRGDGYTGRFRDHVRFLLAPLAAGQTPLGGYLLDAAGRRIGQLELEPDDVRRLAPSLTTLARARVGGADVRLIAGRVIDRGENVPTGDPCVVLAIGSARPDPDECVRPQDSESNVTAVARCSPRAVVLHGTVRRTVRRVELRLGSGRPISVPTKSFPRAFKTSARYYLTVLPRDAAVSEVRFPGHPRDRGRPRASSYTPLAPASAQCGYRFSDAVF